MARGPRAAAEGAEPSPWWVSQIGCCFAAIAPAAAYHVLAAKPAAALHADWPTARPDHAGRPGIVVKHGFPLLALAKVPRHRLGATTLAPASAITPALPWDRGCWPRCARASRHSNTHGGVSVIAQQTATCQSGRISRPAKHCPDTTAHRFYHHRQVYAAQLARRHVGLRTCFESRERPMRLREGRAGRDPRLCQLGNSGPQGRRFGMMWSAPAVQRLERCAEQMSSSWIITAVTLHRACDPPSGLQEQGCSSTPPATPRPGLPADLFAAA